MPTVLMVAEKPSLAQIIYKILSNNQMNTHKSSAACSMHEWTGKFMNMQCKFKMTSVCGHVMSLDFNSKYNNWDKTDPVSSFIPHISYLNFSKQLLFHFNSQNYSKHKH